MLQHLFLTQSQVLQKCRIPFSAKIKAGSTQFFLKTGKETLLLFLLFLIISFELIHFVDKQKHRDLITLQESPERPGMSLHTVRPVDDKHRIVKHLKRPLHLRRKINMPRRIQQRHLHILPRKNCLLGKNRDSSLFFHRKCI